jgi:hypothetical protein
VDVEEAIKINRNPGRGAEQDNTKARGARELIYVLRNVRGPDTDINDNALIHTRSRAADLRRLPTELLRPRIAQRMPLYRVLSTESRHQDAPNPPLASLKVQPANV